MFSRLFDYIPFFKIVLTPLLISTIIGFALYMYFEKNETGSIVFAVCILLGVVAGIISAIKVGKKKGL